MITAALAWAVVLTIYGALAALWLRTAERRDEIKMLALAALVAYDDREAAGDRMRHAAFYGPDNADYDDSWDQAEDALTDAMDAIREATR